MFRILQMFENVGGPSLSLAIVLSNYNTPGKMRCFSVKDLGPETLRSRVVYKFVCAGCNAYFIDETIFTFNIREKVTPS